MNSAYSRRSFIVITVLWPVMIVSTFLSASCAFVSVSRNQHAAAAVVGVEQREVLAGEDVAGVHDAQRREHDPGVAVRVAAAEVVQVDLIGAVADRHLVLERPLRQSPCRCSA